MHPRARLLLSFLAIILIGTVAIPVTAQVVIGTVNTDVDPESAAVNGAANKVYVANLCGTDSNCQSPTGTVSVIDGAALTVQNVHINDFFPYGVAVNQVTNKTYTSTCGPTDASCFSPGTLTVIDGATLATQDVQVGVYTGLLAVNPVTNTIYVANQCGSDTNCNSLGTVTVVNGANLSTRQVNAGAFPYAVAVNSATNKIYVINPCGNDLSCSSNGTVTVIDGATLQTQTVNVGFNPLLLAVNSVTNKIYVVNNCGNDVNCASNGTVTVINGNTLATQTVSVDLMPSTIAVNAVSNKIYVGNDCGTDPNCASSSTLSVIDGGTLSSTHSFVCDAQSYPSDIEVDPVTNKIYMTCYGQSGTLTAIDGTTDATNAIFVGSYPLVAAVDALNNRIFVPNSGDDTVSVAAGPNPAPLQFVNVTPCRVVDTRPPHGNGPIPGGTSQSFVLPQLGGCGIPGNAAAYSLNVTVVPTRPLGYLTIWPTGEDQPVVSTLNAPDGRVKANAAIVPAGYQGAVSVFVTDTTNAILDIDGYFAAPGGQTTQFYPLPPCRVVDTRGPVGDLGGPYLSGGVERDFPVRESTACIPSNANASAYSMNFSVVPHAAGRPLGYLTVWPEGQDQPVVSTLNNPTATVVANAGIVPAGTPNGGIATFAFDDTDLFIDINGYFGPPGQGGVAFYPAAPCRVRDTRANHGQPFIHVLSPPVNVVGSPCAPPSDAQAYVLNATVVPAGGPMGYLTLWPDGQDQPLVSTLNAYDGLITSNMAVVPTSNGSIDAYADGLTHLILDISGYFAPVPMDQPQVAPVRTGTTGIGRQHKRTSQFGHGPRRGGMNRGTTTWRPGQNQ